MRRREAWRRGVVATDIEDLSPKWPMLLVTEILAESQVDSHCVT